MLLLALTAGPGSSVSPKPTREQELVALRAQIAQLQSQLEAARKRSAGLAGEIEQSTLELNLQERRLAEAVAARKIAATRVVEAEGKVSALQTELAAAQDELRRSLTGLYRVGRGGAIRLFLSLRPGQDVLPGLRLARYLARRDAETLRRYRETEARLHRERDRLAGERREAESWVDREKQRRGALVGLRRRQTRLLVSARQEEERLASRAGALEDRERRLAAFLDLLYSGSSDLRGKPMQEFQGLLDWPVEGAVAAAFGPRLDPRYGTRVPHNGIDIEARPGAEVKAIFPGKVLFAAPFEGYGVTVVVLHAGRCLSLYGGLSAVRVAAGDMVSLTSVVGSAGANVYFEIRIENRPEDPRRWLR